ncbi:MAG: hypothetical protein P1U58_04105 [Verrucomicrobiales bacterium]|nr:hypothetical protein [Verrucomicrobiales bacterium]
MQQTSLDRYLRHKYVQRSVVYCNTLPYAIPEGIKVDETTEESGGRYLYRMTAMNDRSLNELTAHLEVANITYTSRIADDEGLNSKLFNNPEKSFTMQIVSIVLLVGVLAFIFSGMPVHLWKTLTVKDENVKIENLIKKTPSAQRQGE